MTKTKQNGQEFWKEYIPYSPSSKEKYLLCHQYVKYKQLSELSQDDLSTPFTNGYLFSH